MRDTALGLVETWGLVPAVAAADAAAKAAPIEVAGTIQLGDGLVTVAVMGSVAAVQLAVEEAGQVAARVGLLRSTRVIARPYPHTWDTLGR